MNCQKTLSPAELKAILFDLDGTLVDTAPDLLLALNRVIQEEGGGSPVTMPQLLPTISCGSPAIVRQGFSVDEDTPEFARLLERFLATYRANIAVRSHLYHGMEKVLAQIEATPMVWGIVTNKGARFTDPLAQSLGLDRRAACIISGDATDRPKPHPDHLLMACAQMGVAPKMCLYIGDAAKDIEAGRRAGMRTAAALFGYITPGDEPENWGADCLLASPGELAAWLGGQMILVLRTADILGYCSFLL